MATSRSIPREQWTQYFDAFTKRFLRDDNPESATVEIINLEVGDQEAVRGARVMGITYDHHDKLLDVALQGIDHLVFNPGEIWVLEEANGFPSAITVVRDDDTREVIHLRSVGIQPVQS